MLTTTIDKIKERYPKAEFIADKCVGTAQERNGLGIKHFISKRGWMGGRRFTIGFFLQRLIGLICVLIPQKARKFYVITDVDMLIDISGFAFTDQWGVNPCRDFSNLAAWYARKGVPVVMLPQAFGPFTSKGIQENIKRIIQSASLIYARDAQSEEYLQEVYPSEVIKKCPDITLFESSGLGASSSSQTVGIVPNMRMLDRGKEWREVYVELLNHICDLTIETGLEPVFVVHDSSGEDRKVVELVQSSRENTLGVIELEDPWELKRELANMRVVIGSRYHALVAAVSSNVPVIALGWSHKYKELLKEFNLEKFLVGSNISMEKLKALVTEVFPEKENRLVRKQIKKHFDNLAGENEEMWDSVYEIISSENRKLS